jgi:hypothetical protein
MPKLKSEVLSLFDFLLLVIHNICSCSFCLKTSQSEDATGTVMRINAVIMHNCVLQTLYLL